MLAPVFASQGQTREGPGGGNAGKRADAVQKLVEKARRAGDGLRIERARQPLIEVLPRGQVDLCGEDAARVEARVHLQ